MTRIKISAFFLAILAFSGCNKDDDDNGPDTNDLTRQAGWQLDDIETNFTDFIPVFLEANDEAVTQVPDAFLEFTLQGLAAMINNPDACAKDDTYFFLPDGSTSVAFGPDECDDEDFQFEGELDDNASWSISGNTLTLTSGGVSFDYTIRTLNATTLVLFFSEPVTGSDFGIDDLNISEALEVEMTFVAR